MILVRSTLLYRKRIVVVALIVTVLISVAFAIDFLTGGFYQPPPVEPQI